MTDPHVSVPPLSIKQNNLELRSCDIHLLSQGEHVTASIVRWVTPEEGEKKYCLCVAYWLCGREGYYLQFVGRRPLELEVDWKAFTELVRAGQDWLDAAWEKEKK